MRTLNTLATCALLCALAACGGGNATQDDIDEADTAIAGMGIITSDPETRKHIPTPVDCKTNPEQCK